MDYNSAPAGVDIIEVRNPATGEVVGHVPIAEAAEIREAASRAKAAQQRWRQAPFSDRGALRAWKRLSWFK